MVHIENNSESITKTQDGSTYTLTYDEVKSQFDQLNPGPINVACTAWSRLASQLGSVANSIRSSAGDPLHHAWQSKTSPDAQTHLQIAQATAQALAGQCMQMARATDWAYQYANWYKAHLPGDGYVTTGADSQRAVDHLTKLLGRYNEVIMSCVPDSVQAQYVQSATNPHRENFTPAPGSGGGGGGVPHIPGGAGGVPGGHVPPVPSHPGLPNTHQQLPSHHGPGTFPPGSGSDPYDPNYPSTGLHPAPLPGTGIDTGSSLAGIGDGSGLGGLGGGTGAGGLGSAGLGGGLGAGSGLGGAGAGASGAAGFGGGAGGAAAGEIGAASGAAGGGARGMMAPMHGGRGGEDDERERSTWLVEDDDVWGAGNPPPPVIGG